MNVYLLMCDGTEDYVEARTYGEAISVWTAAKRREWGDDWTPEDEPESCSLVSDRPVLRGAV